MATSERLDFSQPMNDLGVIGEDQRKKLIPKNIYPGSIQSPDLVYGIVTSSCNQGVSFSVANSAKWKTIPVNLGRVGFGKTHGEVCCS